MADTSTVSTVPCRVAALCLLLDQLDALIDGLDDPSYADPRPAFMHASVGQHVRHTLDHFSKLIDGVGVGLIDYDARVRGTTEETDRAAARALIAGLRAELVSMDESLLDKSVQVRAKMTADADPVTEPSSVGRELVFLVSHTVHHHALIRTMVEPEGRALPDGFGYAPSTIAHRKATGACAR